MRIFIIGYMGSGKSTFGPKLAREMNIPFFDLDDEFEARYRINISGFFLKYGEFHFRDIEHKLLVELAKQEEFILATGGGTPCYLQNMEFMNSCGITVFLKVPLDVLVKRLNESPKKRPLLNSFSQNDFNKHVEDHLRQREFYYESAKLILSPLQIDPKDAALQIRKLSAISQ
ncbi:MAG: shikimate kinase [Bacteroidetes bacterium]|nr:shikimate kinase [Bacteroidota bacterium]